MVEGAVLTEAITKHFELQISTVAIYPAASTLLLPKTFVSYVMCYCYVVFINMKL